jgi:hypothetical protein
MQKRRPSENEMMLNSRAGFRMNFQVARSFLVATPKHNLLQLARRPLTDCLDAIHPVFLKQAAKENR